MNAPDPIVVLVCGGRAFDDALKLFGVLDGIHAATTIGRIIQGGAQGADRLARKWAASRGVRCSSYDAEWHLYGRAAGPLRNQRMLDEGRPDLVVVMPGGDGTADMRNRAMKAGVAIAEDS